MIRRLVVLAVVAGVMLAGCSGQVGGGADTRPVSDPGSSASPVVSGAGPVRLVSVTARGGMCVTGSMCESVFTVLSDGSWTRVPVVDGVASSGVLSAGQVDSLVRGIRLTGLRSAPRFTGTCPMAYDGQEMVYAWTDPGSGRDVSYGSCQVVVSESDPLVAALADVMAAAV